MLPPPPFRGLLIHLATGHPMSFSFIMTRSRIAARCSGRTTPRDRSSGLASYCGFSSEISAPPGPSSPTAWGTNFSCRVQPRSAVTMSTRGVDRVDPPGSVGQQTIYEAARVAAQVARNASFDIDTEVSKGRFQLLT